LERDRKEREKHLSGRLEIIKLEGKAYVVLSKGPTLEEGNWNNQEIKFMIQWYKRVGCMAMSKNKEGLLLRYGETCGRVVTCQDVAVTGVTAHLWHSRTKQRRTVLLPHLERNQSLLLKDRGAFNHV
jgi:hypothetical protein